MIHQRVHVIIGTSLLSSNLISVAIHFLNLEILSGYNAQPHKLLNLWDNLCAGSLKLWNTIEASDEIYIG